MSEPFIAEIKMFAGSFAPRGYAFCDGQLLPINQNQALFALVGTTYGGDGRTTFGLPDMRGRVPIHPGSGPDLSTRKLGEKNGQEELNLVANDLPGSKKQGKTIYTNAYSTESNMPPFTCVSFIIALAGLFPSRN